MKIINVQDVAAKEIVNDPLFSGGTVHLQSILEEDHLGKKIGISNVKFAPGAHSNFHTHSVEQILIPIEGRGIVANRDRENVITPGMVIYIAPGEEHWHGATKDSSFAHLVILGQPHELKIVEE